MPPEERTVRRGSPENVWTGANTFEVRSTTGCLRLRSLVAIPFLVIGFWANSALLYADTISLVYRVNVLEVNFILPTPPPPPPREFFLTATFNAKPSYDIDLTEEPFTVHEQGYRGLSFSKPPLVEFPPPSGANPVRDDLFSQATLATGLDLFDTDSRSYYHNMQLNLEYVGTGTDRYHWLMRLGGERRGLPAQPPLNPLDFGTCCDEFYFVFANEVKYASTGELKFVSYTGVARFDHEMAPVPEPASLLLLGSGLGALGAGKLRRRRLRSTPVG